MSAFGSARQMATETAPGRRRLRGGVLAAAPTALAGCSLLLDFGGSAESDADAGAPDADRIGQACERYEPNESIEDAPALAPGAYELGLCDGTEADFFTFEVDGSEDVTIEVEYEPEEDRFALELHLYEADTGELIESASSVGDGALVLARSEATASQLAADEYAFEIRLDDDVGDPVLEGVYELTLEITAS